MPKPPGRAVTIRAVLYASGLCLLGGILYQGHNRLRAKAEAMDMDEPAILEHAGRMSRRLLFDVLMECGSDAQETDLIVRAFRRSLSPRRLQPEDTYHVVRSTSGEFLHLTLVRGLDRLVVSRDGEGRMRSTIRAIPLHEVELTRSGEIHDSLWVSMQAQDLPAELIMLFADTFQWTVDFLVETRDKDRFAVLWTERRAPDGRVWSRTIEGALYEGSATGRQTAILFDKDFFDEKGEALERMFLRAPLKFSRISSRFNKRRRHPILRIRRPHHGTDYAAPSGTPVSSVASGTVVKVGWQGGLGRAIKIRHNATYSTLYGHMRSYARGMRQGVHVRQGQVVGYVGSTGISSGPHLHFQISKKDRWVDFLKLKIPRTRSVPKQRRQAFDAVRDRVVERLGEGQAGSAAAAR